MSISFSFKLKSHPDKLLYEHLKKVGNLCRQIVLSKQIKNKEVFSEIAYLMGISHDFAKATTYFQEHLEKNLKTELAYHGMLSSIFTYYLVNKYLKFKTLESDNGLSIVAWVAVLKHHGDIQDLKGTEGELEKLEDLEKIKEQLDDIKHNSIEELKEIYRDISSIEVALEEFFDKFEQIVKKIKLDGRKLAMSRNIENYFLILFFYSILLDADKLDASGIEKLPERREIPSDLIDRFREIKFNESRKSRINTIRNEAYEEVMLSLGKMDVKKDRILSIELPTGCGKTLTAFSFALKLREKVKKEFRFTPRIIYSLPFLSIIDQNAEVFSEVLAEIEGSSWKSLFEMEEAERKKKLGEISSNLFLKHHHLADVVYKIKENDEEFEMDVEKSALLIEGWHSEIIATTFVQFFHSLITNRNRAARKFHSMVNSIIILDEIQSIPYKYWVLVNRTLKHLVQEYNCWVILITATMPLIFRKEEGEIKPLIEDKQKYFGKFNRVIYKFDLEEKEFEKFKQEILDEVLKNHNDLMVVLNTIESSKELYTFVKKGLEKKFGEGTVTKEGILEFDILELINLSTHIIPIHRLQRIEKIKENRGRRKVIITTQLIEAGVDISIDKIYRDLAPLDCIIQTAGRCNRNSEREKGIIKIVNLKSRKKNKAFHCIYSHTLINVTKDVIRERRCMFEEKDFIISLLPKYYEYVNNKGSVEEPSEEEIEKLQSLAFSEIAKFKLIEEDYWKIDVFVEIDEEAKQIWNEYEGIMKEQDQFKKREKFLRIKNKFYNYVISVGERLKGSIPFKYNIGYISEEWLAEKYDLQIGFISEDLEETMII